jgi:hypothetical protein
MSERPDLAGDSGLAGIIALLGFVLVATAQITNMILARGLAGSVPPFTLAFFRWTIIAAGLAPFAIAELGSGRLALRIGEVYSLPGHGFHHRRRPHVSRLEFHGFPSRLSDPRPIYRFPPEPG